MAFLDALDFRCLSSPQSDPVRIADVTLPSKILTATDGPFRLDVRPHLALLYSF